MVNNLNMQRCNGKKSMKEPDLSGRMLVICPHFDDACFSVGGFLLKKSLESVTILTVFSKTQQAPNYRFFYPLIKTAYTLHMNFLNRTLVEVISKMRKKEDSQFCRHIGAIQSILPYEDSSIRRCSSINPSYDGDEIDGTIIGKLVFESIKKYVFSEAFDSILCPLGIGNQVDHLIVMNALMRIFNTKQYPELNIFFYEDMPYSYYYYLYKINSLAFARIASNKALYIDVTNEMPLKQKLTDIYRSQGQKKAPILQHAKRLFASRNDDVCKTGFYERIWKFAPS